MAKRRGRKIKEGARYKCGKLKPVERPDDTAIETRMRLFGVSREDARRAETGTAIGRLVDWTAKDNGQLTQDQHAALMVYLKAYHEYQWAMDSKRVRSASDFTGGHGYDASEGDDPTYVNRVTRAIRRFDEIDEAIMGTSRVARSVLLTWVVKDDELWSFLGELRLAANAINRLLQNGMAA